MGALRLLRLNRNSLIRTIPPELGNLAQLATLSLAWNHLEGTIPPELGSLTELQSLLLHNNQLEGTIPRELGNLTKLVWLYLDGSSDLSGNKLTGPIPPELGNLTRLQNLRLSRNELTGSIPPELGALADLRRLSLGNNRLTGRIPPWLANLTHLDYLALSGNELTGPIPPELGDLTELQDLRLGGNQLTGPIPPELGSLFRLEVLGLGSNRLTGSVPPELGNLHQLVILALSNNQLTGSLPHTIAGLNNLVTLGCQETRGVCMPVTDAFRDWSREVEARGGVQNVVDIPWCDEIDAQALEALYEAANGDGWTRSDGWLEDEGLGQWHGVRTDSIGRVTELDLSGNRLSGHLPDAIGSLANLTELRVGDNALSGRLPLSLSRLPLVEFDYTDTSLCVADDAGFRGWLDGIPRHLGTGAQCPPLTEREALEWLFRETGGSRWDNRAGWLSETPLARWHGVVTAASGEVVGLRLRRNGLSGSIPVEIGGLTALTHLDLYGNELSGPMPVEIGQLSQLSVLDLGYNELTGPIPAEVGALGELQTLRLGGNRFSDAIPEEIGRLRELRELRLNGNNLSGPIPPEVGDLGRLEVLWLQRNQLTGEIPEEIGRIAILSELRLYDNNLSGPIPTELGGLDRLTVLDLARNRFSGGIPAELGRLSALRQLDLSDNQLSGPVPPESGTLERLVRMRLDRNELTGEIPEQIGRIASLAELGLADNQLSGPIPVRLGDLANLVQLDLGGNRLTGRLPAELGRVTRLETLDLRSNALSGPVPPEFANLTRLTSLILADNPDLDGPLPPDFQAVGGLNRFMAGGTGLCRPADPGFDAWFRAIPERRLLRCGGGAAVYLTQTVQSWDDPVPLVGGEPALLRVFITAPEEARVSMPDVRATFYVEGVERHTILIPASTAVLPSEVTEADLAVSANAEIPVWLIVPGLEMVIEVDPEGALDPALGITKRIPDSGRMPVDVRPLAPFRLTLIPFLHESESDTSIAESVRAMAEDPDGHELLADVRTLLPVAELDVVAHEPVITSLRDPGRLLGQTRAMRLMEGDSGYWMGVIQPPPRTGGTGWWIALPIGVAYRGGSSSVSIPEAPVMAHELGHNLSLKHAPCGAPRDVDPWFPYPAGNTGAWGYDFATKALVAPSAADLMSYCTQHGYWISDFLFNKALNHRLANAGSAAAAITADTHPTRSLLVWGGRDTVGVPYLDPAFVVDAVPSLPPAGTEYTIEGTDADGTPLFSFTFDMPEIADAEGAEASFVFALPVEAGWAGNLASITLSGPGGSVTLDENTDRPMAILRDPRTGQVRRFLSGAPARTQVAADAAGRAAGPPLETLFSRGLPDAGAWRR